MAVSQKKRCGSVLVELGHGLDLDEAAEVQLGHGGDEAAGLVRAEEFGVDLVDRAPVLALRGEDTAVDDLVAASARRAWARMSPRQTSRVSGSIESWPET